MKQRVTNSSTYGDGPQGTKVADIDREAYILANLEHENIVKLHEVFYRDDSVVLILDLVTGGELFARVAECERLSEEEASNFVEQILLGVKHMHDLGVVHLDLKPENIMIEDLASRKIKIIDFGLARVLHPNQTFQDMAGTPEFCAPEIVNYDPITFATDMWAIGVITYILLTGISPFAGDSQIETFQNILDCIVDYQREEIRDTTDLAKDFIRKLLMKNPRKRFTVNECLMHAWIKPCDTAQKDSRRDSVIRRQNLNGLRNFIAYPSPPASPIDVAFTPTDNNTHHFFDLATSADPESPVTSNGAEGSSFNDPTVIEPLKPVRQPSIKECPADPPVDPSDSTNSITQCTMSQRQPSDTKPYQERHKPNDRISEPCVNLSVQSENQSSARSPTVPPPKPVVVEKSGWKASFGSSLIGRLGAAFAAATIHSTTQVSSVIKAYTTSTTSHVETVTSAREKAPASNIVNENSHEEHLSETVHRLSTNSQASIVNSSGTQQFLQQPIQDPRESKLPKTPARRGLQLGNVSRAVLDFENSVSTSTDSDDAAHNSAHNQSSRISKPRQQKSHSIAQSAEKNIWNAHRHSKHSSTQQQLRQPVREHVGRLQELFERRASGSQTRPNGGPFPHRASHS
ncbi:death-associated protein kinase 1 [Clonorchis sinensis]|nr:death-associated protein kinase 1 [Clonorchis sinensis]